MIILYGSCRWSLGESREVQPLWLIGEFSALLAMRLGKFPNKLWYFLAEIPPCVIGMPIEPACGLCSLHSLYPLCSLYRVCRTSRTAVAISMLAQPKLSIYYFSFRSVGGGAVVFVFKGSFARGGRIQGFPDKYARSEARGRFVGKRHSRLTLKPTSSPVLNLPLKTGMIAPLCLRQGNYHLYFPPNSVNFVVLVY